MIGCARAGDDEFELKVFVLRLTRATFASLRRCTMGCLGGQKFETERRKLKMYYILKLIILQ